MLDKLIKEHNADYSSVSKMLGRNPSYIQQFIKRGTPRKLDERDRAILARHFRVQESLLGGPVEQNPRTSDLVQLPILNLEEMRSSRGLAPSADDSTDMVFEMNWLQNLSGRLDPNLAILYVADDSMEPTLRHHDQVIIDLDSSQDELNGGVYAVLAQETFQIRRITAEPTGQGYTIVSDNPLYGMWESIPRQSIKAIGRVIWVGRKIL
jgi:phage repressor protein C with HTH and peptisase S24 domain